MRRLFCLGGVGELFYDNSALAMRQRLIFPAHQNVGVAYRARRPR